MSAWLASVGGKTPEVDAAPASDPSVQGAAETDESTYDLLFKILEACRELGGVKPIQAAASLYFLLNHPEISQAVEEQGSGDPETELPPETEVFCRISVSSYAKYEANALKALGPAFNKGDIIFAQYKPYGLLPAHIVIWDEHRSILYISVRGTSDWRDAVKDLAGSSTAFLDSTAHAGMAAAANAFFTPAYAESFTKGCSWLKPAAEAKTAKASDSPVSDEDPLVVADDMKVLAPLKVPEPVEPEGRVDSGLFDIIQRLWALRPGAKVMFCGHSLGAATAALACCKLRAMLACQDARAEPGAAEAEPVAMVDMIGRCHQPVRAVLCATPACAAPEIALATEALCEDGQNPIIMSVILADDFVPRLTIASVKALHAKLADEHLATVANSELYTNAKEASLTALSNFVDKVTGGPEGKIQCAGRYLADGVVSLVNSPKVTNVTTAVTGKLHAVMRKWKGTDLKALHFAYGATAAASTGAIATASAVTVMGTRSEDARPSLNTEIAADSKVSQELSPLISPRMRKVYEAFRKEACDTTQRLVVPGRIYHVTRVVGGGEVSKRAGVQVSTPVHQAVAGHVAAADAVHTEGNVDSARIVRDVERQLAAGTFRVHVVPPARLSRIRISSTMLTDHKKKGYLATCEALMLRDAASAGLTPSLNKAPKASDDRA